ncbi:hypothetical protein K2227_18400 [Shewanella putrefaciens]|nr:hypothetical protein K2227_18400 [Shewanella putrefaciens]
MNTDKTLDEITQENSFWKLYKACRKIPTSKENIVVFVFSFVFFYTLNMYSLQSNAELIVDIVTTSTNLISWSVSLIGFVLSGYAIYATLADKKMQLKMAYVHDKKNNMNYLKSTHCIFMKIVIDMISVVFLVYILTNEALLEHIAAVIPNLNNGLSLSTTVLCIHLGWIQSLFVFEIMLAKSFVYNVYHSVMVSIRWTGINEEDEEEEEEEEEKE